MWYERKMEEEEQAAPFYVWNSTSWDTFSRRYDTLRTSCNDFGAWIRREAFLPFESVSCMNQGSDSSACRDNHRIRRVNEAGKLTAQCRACMQQDDWRSSVTGIQVKPTKTSSSTLCLLSNVWVWVRFGELHSQYPFPVSRRPPVWEIYLPTTSCWVLGVDTRPLLDVVSISPYKDNCNTDMSRGMS